MGHDKLRKFAENETFSCLIQPSADELLSDGFLHLRDHAVKGHWAERLQAASGDPAEIVLELGCGKGEYTLELARRNPQNIYIGVDIKGARLWRGAKTATQEALSNVAFLRTRIEFINAFFAPGEVSQIWLTFSDPQMKSENSRLTSPVFLERYRKFLRPGGTVHLKTDSRFLHEYTKAVVAVNGFRLLACTDNLYGDAALGRDFQGSSASPHPTTGFAGGPPASGPRAARPLEIPALGGIPAEVREVQTYYESMFLQQGLPISYMAFTIDGDGPIAYPRDPEDFDSKTMRAAEKAR